MNTPQDLIIPVEVPTTTTQEVGVTAKEISILFADAHTPGVLAVLLAAKDEAGAWREDVKPVLVRAEDALTSEVPQKRFAASMFHDLMFSAIVSDTPAHRALGVAGLSVWDAAKALLPGFLGDPNQ